MDENESKIFDPNEILTLGNTFESETEKEEHSAGVEPLAETGAKETSSELNETSPDMITTTETPADQPNADEPAFKFELIGETPLPEMKHEPPVFYHETVEPPAKEKRRTRRGRFIAAVLIACTLGTGTLGLGIGIAIPFAERYIYGERGKPEPSGDSLGNGGVVSSRTVFTDEGNPGPRTGNYSDVVRLVEPTVVSIYSMFENSGNVFGGQQMVPAEASGFIFKEDASSIYIATNSHVVGGAASVSISIEGSEPIPAKPVGRDPAADLAVISVEKRDLKDAGVMSVSIAVFGDSDDMSPGDSVLAIGNAMGEGISTTLGIISAKEKDTEIQGRVLTVLQTDAAINSGNSGGPLVNTKGEVIGINTAKMSSYFYSVEGVGYSISSNIALPILESIIADSGPKPFLGIQGDDVTEEIAEQFNIPAIGVYVYDVIANSSAEKAGIVRSDIITSFNGNAVFTMDQLREEVGKCSIGDTVEVKALRDGKTPITFTVKLGTNEQDKF